MYKSPQTRHFQYSWSITPVSQQEANAIKNFVKLQRDYECYFMLADLHSITVFQDPKQLRENIIETAAVFLACGLDPKKMLFFVSRVSLGIQN